MKTCSKCKIEKEESEFYKDKSKKDGLCSYCRICHNERTKIYFRTVNGKKYLKEYVKRNSEKSKGYKKKYSQKSSSKNLRNEWFKKRRIVDAKFKLDMNMATAIGTALKGKKASSAWKDLTGYTIESLMKHLENKFESWMNWNNYGKWHVDHIKPKSLFKYETAEDSEFKKCWALENLQPLEATKNMSKKDIFIDELGKQ